MECDFEFGWRIAKETCIKFKFFFQLVGRWRVQSPPDPVHNRVALAGQELNEMWTQLNTNFLVIVWYKRTNPEENRGHYLLIIYSTRVDQVILVGKKKYDRNVYSSYQWPTGLAPDQPPTQSRPAKFSLYKEGLASMDRWNSRNQAINFSLPNHLWLLLSNFPLQQNDKA